jgi:Zn finger protein HypA/HybF involved in hydrogenase expression
MTKLLSFDDNGVQFAWDSTSIKLVETCLRKYQYKMIFGWQPRRKSVHLLFGGWYAKALESYYKYVAEGMSAEDAEIEVVSEALFETWEYPECDSCKGSGKKADEEKCPWCAGEGVMVVGDVGQPWISDHNTKTRENLIRTIVWYLDQFGEDDSCTTAILTNGAPAVEHSFRLEADDGIILSGHLDRLVEYGGKPYIQDQKTTGSTITTRYFDNFNPDTQMSLYTFAGKAIFGIPVKGVMIDAAQIAVGFTRFERGFTFRDESQLNEWYDNAMFYISQARTATRDNYFPLNPSSCSQFGGCEFRGICSKSLSVRDNFLKGDFVQGKRWDPLEVR